MSENASGTSTPSQHNAGVETDPKRRLDSELTAVDGIAERVADIESEYLLSQGQVVSRQDILRREALSAERVNVREAEAAQEGTATAEYLRRHVPVNLRRKLQVQVMGAEKGRLRIVSRYKLTDSQRDTLIQAVREIGVRVHDVAREARPANETKALLQIGARTTEVQLKRNLAEMSVRPEDASGETVRDNLYSILDHALENRASDVHFDFNDLEDMTAKNWIFYRIDGEIQPKWLMSPGAMRTFIAVLKQLSGMDHTDKIRPQDGRLHHVWENRSIDCRVASIPIHGGEKVTLRLLETSTETGLAEIFSPDSPIVGYLEKLVNKDTKDGGIVLLSGPTGSGKSTTMAAIMRAVPRHRKNVLTIENPVEYRIPLARQIEVNPDRGQKFASVIRAVMRHDPDVIGIGEMRDAETAEAAMNAAETGHLVVSTVHAIGAIPTIERSLSLFAENYRHLGSYVLGTTVRAVVNHRLAPRLCPACSKTGTAGHFCSVEGGAAEGMDPGELGISPEEQIREANMDGCSYCDYSGILGRVLAPEILVIPADAKTRDKVVRWIVENQLHELRDLEGYVARSEVLRTLVRDGTVGVRTALNMIEEERG